MQSKGGRVKERMQRAEFKRTRARAIAAALGKIYE